MIDAAPLVLGPLALLRPQWLVLLLALPLLAVWLRSREHARNPWRQVVDAHLLPHLLSPAPARGTRLRMPAVVLACALAIVALAGPSWRTVAQPMQAGRAPLVIALDLSSAIAAPDLAPTRLLQARAKIAALLDARGDGEIGLVAFADDAFTVAPLTTDVANVALFLDALSPDVMPLDGSRADRAVAWSARLLRQAGHAHGDILLLTDHADDDAVAAARKAASDGFRVSALGLGTTTGAAYRKPEGGIASARLAPAGLRALATAGGGRYVAATVDAGDLAALAPRAAADAASDRGGGARAREDGGYWLLLPLLLLATFAFRRNGVVAVLAIGIVLPLLPVHAQSPASPTPAEAPRGTAWQRADQQAHARMEAGIAAYREKDYDAALRAWQGLPSADAAYNRGNALAEAGRYEAAIAAYDDALRKAPRMADATANRTAVLAALKRKPPQGAKQDRQGESKDTPQPGGEGKRTRPDDAARSGADAGQAPPATPPTATPPASTPPPQQGRDAPAAAPGDVQAQRDADAAQRERMRQALADGEGDVGEAAGEPPADRTGLSRADRERAASNAAWLRRVPDDPGGLLRVKFRLEHERRRRE